MERIKLYHLLRDVTYLNQITGNPVEAWKTIDGKSVAQVGCFYIAQGYGGYALEQMLSEGGTCRSVFECGFNPARETHYRIRAFIKGIQEARDPQAL